MDIWRRAILFLAGLFGAAGVAAAAAAAHVAGGALLETAAHFLILHAAALAGLSGVILAVSAGRAALLAGASALALGTLLFAGDVALRGLTDSAHKLGTAPIGGSVLITGWLVVAVAGLVSRRG